MYVHACKRALGTACRVACTCCTFMGSGSRGTAEFDRLGRTELQAVCVRNERFRGKNSRREDNGKNPERRMQAPIRHTGITTLFVHRVVECVFSTSCVVRKGCCAQSIRLVVSTLPVYSSVFSFASQYLLLPWLFIVFEWAASSASCSPCSSCSPLSLLSSSRHGKMGVGGGGEKESRKEGGSWTNEDNDD